VTRRCPCRRRAQCVAAERAAIPLQRHLDSCVISSSVGRSRQLNLPSPGFRVAAERAAIPLQRHLDSCVISSSVGRSRQLNLPSPGFRPGFFGFAFFLPLEKGAACRLGERSFSSRRRLSAAISAASRAFCSRSSMTSAISVLDAQL